MPNLSMSAIPIYLYSGLLELARLTVLPLIANGARGRRWCLRERLTLPAAAQLPAGGEVVWLHAASLGESKLLLKFLPLLLRRHPQDRYVATAATAAGVDFLRNSCPPQVLATGFLPYDTLALMNAMLDRFRIGRLWLMETELWPSMLWACKSRGVKVGIVNGRLEEKSLAAYRRFRSVLKPLLAQVGPVFVQDAAYRQRFETLGVCSRNIAVTGNLKSQITMGPPAEGRRASLRAALNISPVETVVTVGCLHPGEVPAITAAIETLTSQGLAWKWILVPRHLNKSAEIRAQLDPAAPSVQTLRLAQPWQVCCVEAYGVLEEMYLIADAAVVGGTFIDIGGHNMWEPAQFCMPVFFGPHYHEQRASSERLLAAGVGFCVPDGPGLAAGLQRTLTAESGNFRAAAAALAGEINRQSSGLEELIP